MKGASKKRLKKMKRDKRLTMGGTSEDAAYRDMKLILDGNELIKPLVTRERVSKELVEECVAWVLTQDNVGVLSWGTKQVKFTRIWL